MVTSGALRARPPWQDAHFVGGHLVLDLANTVFDRTEPVPANDLLRSAADVLSWCESVGLFDTAPAVIGAAERTLLADVRAVREQAADVFTAVARGEPVPAATVGELMERAGTGMRGGRIRWTGASGGDWNADGALLGAIPTALALAAIEALFTLPLDRVRACDRCGWLFLDTSRGGRRRWCSMSTCGNREKASRHRRVDA